MSGSLRRTALHAWHVAHGGRMVDFAGWEMPVQYRSILEEHRAVRTAAGWFDVSHMGEVEVRGPGAQAFLNRVVTNDVARIVPGRALYTPMCREDGGTVDDLIIYQLGVGAYLLCVNASNTAADVAHLRSHVPAEGVEVVDVSDQWSLVAVQGPLAEAVLAAVPGGAAAAALARFGVARMELAGGLPAVVARTGYTGEDGFEVFVPWGAAEGLVAALEAAGGARGLVPCGLGARDSLRTEAGYPLYGHELGPDRSPLAAGLEWTVKWTKGDFVGRAALAAERERGRAKRLLWFRLGDRRIARPGTPVVTAEGVVVGEVASGTFSPGVGEAIGSAWVEASAAAGILEVDLRGTRLSLVPVRPPFVPLRGGG